MKRFLLFLFSVETSLLASGYIISRPIPLQRILPSVLSKDQPRCVPRSHHLCNRLIDDSPASPLHFSVTQLRQTQNNSIRLETRNLIESKMVFRERLKKAFKSSSPSSSKASSPIIEQQDIARWPSNVYKPGEQLPRAKYRAPVKKEHKDKLDSFTFGSAWRRRSQQSLYSPMGSRMPSRRGSLARRPSYSSKRPSFSGKSRMSFSGASVVTSSAGQRTTAPSYHEDSDYASKDASRSGSIGGTTVDKRFKDPHGAAVPTRLTTEMEQEGDDDVGNGMSQHLHRKPSIVTCVLPDYTSPKHTNMHPNMYRNQRHTMHGGVTQKVIPIHHPPASPSLHGICSSTY